MFVPFSIKSNCWWPKTAREYCDDVYDDEKVPNIFWITTLGLGKEEKEASILAQPVWPASLTGQGNSCIAGHAPDAAPLPPPTKPA